MDLTGEFSKLAPPLTGVAVSHRAIRRRTSPPRPQRRRVNQVSRPHEAALRDAESAYLMGRPLKVIAKEVGIGHERLSRLLRERGVRLRSQSPTPEQTAEMKTRYEEGTSLERIGAVLGYSAGTVRNHLLAAGATRHSRMRRTGTCCASGCGQVTVFPCIKSVKHVCPYFTPLRSSLGDSKGLHEAELASRCTRNCHGGSLEGEFE